MSNDGVTTSCNRSHDKKGTSTGIATGDVDAPPTLPRYCHLCISVAGATPKRVVVELNREICPMTCRNFVNLCRSDAVAVRRRRTGGPMMPPVVPTYRNTEFHRVVPGFMVQGGDYENFDGSGGPSSLGGGTFPDENFATRHDAEGVVSMANRGPNTNGSQFFITLGRASHLDGKHVAFGRVVEGMDVVRSMGSVETDGDRPVNMQRIVVVDCGVGRGDGDEKGGGGGGGEGVDGQIRAGRSDERKGGSSRKRKKKKKEEKRRRRKHRSRSRSRSFSSSGTDGDSDSGTDGYDSGGRHHRDRRGGRRRRSTSRSRSKSRGRDGRRKEKSSRRRHSRHNERDGISGGSDGDESSSSSRSVERHGSGGGGGGKSSRKKQRSRKRSRDEDGRPHHR